jgi:hypothetical protein
MEMIQPNSSQSDWTEIWSELLLPNGTYVQSLGSIVPAVTKCAVLTDDRQHVIA